MLSHVSLKVNDIAQAKEFYSKVLAPLGYKADKEYPEYKILGMMDGQGNHDLWIDGNGCAQATHIAFSAQSEEEVQAFYKAALEAGGHDNGAPGYRTDYGAGYYAAFVLDHHGHNIEAMYWNPAK